MSPSHHRAVPATHMHSCLSNYSFAPLELPLTLRLGRSHLGVQHLHLSISPSSAYLKGPESSTGVVQIRDFLIGKYMAVAT